MYVISSTGSYPIHAMPPGGIFSAVFLVCNAIFSWQVQQACGSHIKRQTADPCASTAEGSICLRDGPDSETIFGGRVLIYHNNEWRHVCNERWDDLDAYVVCRQLGLYGGLALRDDVYPPSDGEDQPPAYWLQDVRCYGGEAALADCQRDEWGDAPCGGPLEGPASVHCYKTPSSPVGDRYLSISTKVRLTGGRDESSGRVEVYHQGVWGSVCDDRWTQENTRVVCAQLGYASGFSQGTARYGGIAASPGEIWLDDVSCRGTEASIDRCVTAPPGVHNCQPSEDVAVYCHGEASNSEVRLVDGPNAREGRLEVFHRDEWGSVCDDRFTGEQLVCRLLGFTGGELLTSGEYGYGGGHIMLDEVVCAGTESRLMDCARNKWYDHDCTHEEDVTIRCSP